MSSQCGLYHEDQLYFPKVRMIIIKNQVFCVVVGDLMPLNCSGSELPRQTVTTALLYALLPKTDKLVISFIELKCVFVCF